MTTDSATPPLDSQTASGLHARLRAATIEARTTAAAVGTSPRARSSRRLAPGAEWTLLSALRRDGALDSTLSADRAVRRVLAELMTDAGPDVEPASLDQLDTPPVIVRSGPWPVLRLLLQHLPASVRTEPVTVLVHARDVEALNSLGADLGLTLVPLTYPRFEPFRTSVLQRLLATVPCTRLIVLDAATTGRGDALEHVIASAPHADICVWNGGGHLLRRRPLDERLPREDYAAVRALLRWRTARER